MKFNVYITLKGAGSTVEAPVKGNPLEAQSLNDMLMVLAASDALLNNDMVRAVGVRVEVVDA